MNQVAGGQTFGQEQIVLALYRGRFVFVFFLRFHTTEMSLSASPG